MTRVLRNCVFATAAFFFCIFQVSAALAASQATFSEAGNQATSTLLNVLYAGEGLWRDCNQPACRAANADWGADSGTYTLYLRWSITHDPKIRDVMTALLRTSRTYPNPCAAAPCASWSDTPSWDAVALMRENEVLGGSADAIERAKAALRYVEQSKAFTGGACPEIPYQMPAPSSSHVKSIETDANAIKAALLVYYATGEDAYLQDAITRYATARRYYLAPDVALYSVHVIDDGRTCAQVSRRFFASVNGDMIWNGLQLWRITGDRSYYDDALSTAQAVDSNLSDSRGVFVDLQGENDVVEPLVEAMFDLATNEKLPFARDWLLRNAAAALGGRAPDGTFSRFFDGPSQDATSIWESNGGLALEIAAAALAPDDLATGIDSWSSGKLIGQRVTTLPATVSFYGSGIALVGTAGKAVQSDHVRVFVDGVETFDRTGLWQNLSMPAGKSVLFAWSWPAAGQHTIRLEPGDPSQIGASVLNLESVVQTDRDSAAGMPGEGQ